MDKAEDEKMKLSCWWQMPRIRWYKFLSAKNLKDVNLPKIHCQIDLLLIWSTFYSSHSYPLVIIATLQHFYCSSHSLRSAIAHFSHVHAAHGLIIILSHIFIYVSLVCALTLSPVYHRSLSLQHFIMSVYR